MKRLPPSPGRFRLPLILSLIVIVLGLAGLYGYEQIRSGKRTIEAVHIDSSASVVLNGMHQTSSRNGIKEWTLDAASARLLKDENLAVMESIRVAFFMEGGKEIRLTSDTGALDTRTHDMTFSGNVTVTHADFRLLTDKLQYEKKRHIMFSTTRLTITDSESTITADSFETDLAKGVTVFKGNVRGQFSETFDLFHAFRDPSD